MKKRICIYIYRYICTYYSSLTCHAVARSSTRTIGGPTYIDEYVNESMHIYIYIHTYTYGCVYRYTCIFICVCVCLYMHACMHTYLRTCTQTLKTLSAPAIRCNPESPGLRSDCSCKCFGVQERQRNARELRLSRQDAPSLRSCTAGA